MSLILRDYQADCVHELRRSYATGYRAPDAAAALDRQADLWLSIGRHDTAERLSHMAADLRQAVAA
jgi:hypothetical protein